MELTAEQIKCYAQIYLYIFTEANSAQIADFIQDNLDVDIHDYFDIHKILANDAAFRLRKRGNGASIFRLNI